MADVKNAIEELYEVRDYRAKDWLVKELSDFLSHWADASLHDVRVADVGKSIDEQMPGLLAEFAGFLMVGLCNMKDGPLSATIQARFLEMFESGMCEAPVMLRLDTRTPATEDEEPWTLIHQQTMNGLQEILQGAPSVGPDEYVDFMGSLESALDDFKGLWV